MLTIIPRTDNTWAHVLSTWHLLTHPTYQLINRWFKWKH